MELTSNIFENKTLTYLSIFLMLFLFQAKLVKYKAEAVDSGEQVEQLTTQARIDQETIRNLQSKVEDQNQQLQTQKVSFRYK